MSIFVAGISNRETLEKVERGYRMPKPDSCPDPYYRIMLQCWDKKSQNRPTFEYLQDFFENYFVTSQDYYQEINDTD